MVYSAILFILLGSVLTFLGGLLKKEAGQWLTTRIKTALYGKPLSLDDRLETIIANDNGLSREEIIRDLILHINRDNDMQYEEIVDTVGKTTGILLSRLSKQDKKIEELHSLLIDLVKDK